MHIALTVAVVSLSTNADTAVASADEPMTPDQIRPGLITDLVTW